MGTELRWEVHPVSQLPQKMSLVADGFSTVGLISAGAVDEVIPIGLI